MFRLLTNIFKTWIKRLTWCWQPWLYLALGFLLVLDIPVDSLSNSAKAETDAEYDGKEEECRGHNLEKFANKYLRILNRICLSRFCVLELLELCNNVTGIKTNRTIKTKLPFQFCINCLIILIGLLACLVDQ